MVVRVLRSGALKIADDVCYFTFGQFHINFGNKPLRQCAFCKTQETARQLVSLNPIHYFIGFNTE